MQNLGNNAMEEKTEASLSSDAPAADMVMKTSRDWKGWSILILGAGSVFAGIIAAIGVRFGLWPFETGRTIFIWSAIAAICAVVFGLLIGWLNSRKSVKSQRIVRWAGIAIGAGYSVWFLKFAFAYLGAPAIHDVSTALADPPGFSAIAIRADNLDAVPGIDDPDMRGLNPQQRWVSIHQKSYGDIRSVQIGEPVPQLVEKAERLAKGRGWDVLVSDPAQGRVEATHTSTFFGLKSDVVLRIRPNEAGDASIVDMRSISRVGESDLGGNAERIRSFLADLSGTVTAQ